MDKSILNENQKELLNIVKYFSSKNFYLAGGTALALQLSHRESIDFDIFSYEEFDNSTIYKDLGELGIKDTDIHVVIDKKDEYTLFIKGVKFTFLRYPFLIRDVQEHGGISLATPLTIGAMKAYALGRRGKWKDYTDLYVILQRFSISEVISKAEEIYKSTFSAKMFLQQLCYFDDIDYTEEVKWKIDEPPSKEEIKLALVSIATAKKNIFP